VSLAAFGPPATDVRHENETDAAVNTITKRLLGLRTAILQRL
jgi:hypothetical protein